MGCANVAHAFAGIPADDRFKGIAERAPNVGLVTAYNDMLSAHASFARFPGLIKKELRRHGATGQVAGGVPAMCDGVREGMPGMESSLFSRDVIAMAAAIALSHDMFDAAQLLGVCDKIVPGLLIGALQFGHLRLVLVPAGPMTSGLSNTEKTKVRGLAAQGLAGREELMAAESVAYHGPGTSTFHGTSSSNQMLMEAMGLHVPGTAFVDPGIELRDELTRDAARIVRGIAARHRFTPIGRLVDERSIVDAMVTLLATGGSTNHLIHWVAIARAAGLVIDWDDFAALSDVTPLLSRVYPNGSADVNQFQAAGGPDYVIRELLDGDLMHPDTLMVCEGGLREYTAIAEGADDGASLRWRWRDICASRDGSIVRPADAPSSAMGGLKLLRGNLGRSVIKISAVASEHRVVEAPARVFESQEAVQQTFKDSTLDHDVVVVRWQGPCANGMPELHKLTPVLGILQEKGRKVALLTDGRMSEASGQVPAAIHLSPEAHAGGALTRVRDGDTIRLDAEAGTLDALVPEGEWQARDIAVMTPERIQANMFGMGRELFGAMRTQALSAGGGAGTWLQQTDA